VEPVNTVVECNDNNDVDGSAPEDAADRVHATSGTHNVVGIDVIDERKDSNAMDGTPAPTTAKIVLNIVEKNINADKSVDAGDSAAEADKDLDNADNNDDNDIVSFT
jgi:hypothetical protein